MLVTRSWLSQPIRPMHTEQISRRTSVNPQLGTWVTAIVTATKTVLSSLANRTDRDAHIQAQNQAGSDLSEIYNRIQVLLRSGELTDDQVEAAILGTREIAEEFKAYAASVGTERAAQGSREITALADQLINDYEKLYGGNVVIDPTTGLPIPGTGTGGGFSFQSLTTTALPWIMGIGALFIFSRVSKKGGY